jgi:hypothetical protein
MQSGIDYIQEQIERGNTGNFASNQFTNEEALQFFQTIEQLGGHVTIPEIYKDHDGPGEDYADSCEVHLYTDTLFGEIMITIIPHSPDDMEFKTDLVWLWWD